MDGQLIEILGRNRLVHELLLAGLEVGLPMRDHGIDLIAYADLADHVVAFAACPIQMKAASAQSFSINSKYAKFPNLIHAYVWGIGGTVEAATYAMTQTEAVGIADEMGYTLTASWRSGAYATQKPSRRLLEALAPFRMTPALWREKVMRLQQAASDSGIGGHSH